jgi:hypothetical protein
MPILAAAATSLDDIRDICVAVHSKGGHVGLIYRDEDGRTVYYIHLRWHHQLERTRPDSVRYPVWVEPELPPGRAVIVAELCKLIFDLNAEQEIPYSFGSPDGVFDPTGHLRLGPKRLGLTCATFVLAVFDAAGNPLIDYSQWPQRPEDREWCEYVIGELERSNAEASHVTALRADGISVRYKPLEVAGSASCEPLPTTFLEAQLGASTILEILEESAR